MAGSSTTLSGVLSAFKAKNISNMPTVTTTATTSSTPTWSTPTITPPSASENPNIWQSNKPSGLVFIAVGSVVGLVFLLVLALFIFKKLWAIRTAKHTLNLNSSHDFGEGSPDFSSSYGKFNESNDKLLNTFYSKTSNNRSSMNVSHLYENNNILNNSLADLSNLHSKPNETIYSTLNSYDNNKRRSMFISPTHEVMNMQRQHTYNQETDTPLINYGGQTDSNSSPSDTSNTDITDSNEKDDSDTEVTDSNTSEVRGSNRRHKNTPSVYLDDLING